MFYLEVGTTLEQQKNGRSSLSRKRDAYTIEELLSIKLKIDETYTEKPERKLRAYGILFGVYTGVRRGNLLGLKAKNIFPDDEVPHFEIADNVVPGYSRGQKGVFVAPIATKTSAGDKIALPLLQPDEKVVVEVARYLKANLKPEQPLLKCDPNRVAKWWKEISRDCGFKYLSPHDWKHSYATNGALNLHVWYQGNAYLLQQCCLHRKFETTQKYIRQTSKAFLNAFRKKA